MSFTRRRYSTACSFLFTPKLLRTGHDSAHIHIFGLFICLPTSTLCRTCQQRNIKYIHSSNTSTNFYKVSTGYMFRPTWAIIRPHIRTGSFDYSTFWDPKQFSPPGPSSGLTYEQVHLTTVHFGIPNSLAHLGHHQALHMNRFIWLQYILGSQTVWDPKMYCSQMNLFICKAWWWPRWAETCSLWILCKRL